MFSEWVWRVFFAASATSHCGLQYRDFACFGFDAGRRDNLTSERFCESGERIYWDGDGDRQRIPERNQFLACAFIYALSRNITAGDVFRASSGRNVYDNVSRYQWSTLAQRECNAERHAAAKPVPGFRELLSVVQRELLGIRRVF